jgi:hypothetical protein
MKKTLLALALAATTANAEVVTVSGYGHSYEQAMANCQLTASKKVTGTWIAAEQGLFSGEYSEQIATYDGAIINSTRVISYQGNAMICEVDVEPSTGNRVITETSVRVPDLRKQNEERRQFNKAVSFLDNKHRAMKPVVKDITYKPRGDYTTVYVDMEVQWDPKWIADTERLLEKTEDTGESTYDIRNQILGVLGNAGVTSGNGIVTAIFGSMMHEQHQTSNDHMICLGGTKKEIADDCYNTNLPLQMFDGNIEIIGSGMNGSKEELTLVHKVETNNMYERILPNQTKSHRNFRNVKLTYLQNGTAVYADEKLSVKFGFDVPNDRLNNVDKFDFKIK